MKSCNLIKGVVIGEINIMLIYNVVIRLRKITEDRGKHAFHKKVKRRYKHALKKEAKCYLLPFY